MEIPLCKNCAIRTSSCFASLRSEDIKELEEKKRTTYYKKGQNIFYAGRVPTGIYCLNKGKIKIAKTGVDGKEQIVRFVVEGGLLGIRALVGGRSYSATASAIEDSTVCFISKRAFFKLTIKYPEISQCLMISLSHLLEEAENKMISLAQKPVRERLAESLLILNDVFQSSRDGCPPVSNAVISLTREELANLVGTATETVIRLLSDFKDESLISVNGRKIFLENIEGLKEVANLDV